jgi:hypothetical protein
MLYLIRGLPGSGKTNFGEMTVLLTFEQEMDLVSQGLATKKVQL